MIGQRLGPYQVISKLGEGGMGEVYRARDTTLRREVAIKVLPEIFAADPARLARFKREAELLAALNHPNIASVYGVEASSASSSGHATFAIVLELVDGDTLADRIARGPIEVDEALSIARQIADALEAAHDRGVIHRDLKPANIKITDDGRVKVLDFGLAKMAEGDASNPALSMSPTFTAHETHAGVILGTAAYMSPEQARGRPVDRRTDIWAFGCVLFEMLTGRRTFEAGDTVSDAIAAILKSDPDWKALPPNTPPHIRRLVRRCLQKDAQKRLPHIGLARLEIDEGPADLQPISDQTSTIAPKAPLWRRALAIGAVAIVAAALGVSAGWYLTRSPSPPIVRFPIALDPEQVFTGQGRRSLAISPDGTQIAYVADRKLLRRVLSHPEPDLLVNDDTPAGGVTNPAFSPDGRSIAYVSAQDRTLRRVPVDGGTPVTVCSLPVIPYGVSWEAAGILFEADGSIMRVSPDGGQPERLIAQGTSDRLRDARMLPDGRTVLFTLVDATVNTKNVVGKFPTRIVAQSLTSSEPQVLVEGGAEGRYLPTGHLAYVSGGIIFVVPFDIRNLKVTGGPMPLVQGVKSEVGVAHYDVSATGSLAYVPGPTSGMAGEQHLALIDRTGKVELLKLPPSIYSFPRFSPDGRHVAVEIDSGNDANIWIYELSGVSALRRLTFGGRNRVPAWSADGQQVAFQSDRDGDAAVFAQRADGAGSAERLTTPEKDVAHVPESWSSNGHLLFTATQGPESTLWTYSVHDKTSRPFDAVRASRQPTNAAFSPNGLWVAYQSNETGPLAVYVQPFPATGSRFQASLDAPQDAPHHPLWSRDGTELFYVAGPNRLVVTRVSERSGLSFSNPVVIQTGTWKNTFGGPTTIRNYDVSTDGKRFIGVIASGTTDSDTPRTLQQLQVVLNWFEEVKQRMPRK
jgi:serine/threonine protein kinase/Tol biopolymer transport system component